MKHIFGIRDISLELFENRVSNRVQSTRVDNSRLLTPKLTCGVAQGSNLGPLPFL